MNFIKLVIFGIIFAMLIFALSKINALDFLLQYQFVYFLIAIVLLYPLALLSVYVFYPLELIANKLNKSLFYSKVNFKVNRSKSKHYA